jgi:hypothetical protein
MSESVKPTPTFEETMAKLDKLRNYFLHLKDHVCEVPVRTKKYDPNCVDCQMELQRIHKKSGNLPGVELDGGALASVSFTSLLCHLQMHEECLQYYAMKVASVEFRCTCSCHNKPIKKQARKRTSRSANS